MTFPVTALYASLLALMMVGLFAAVAAKRSEAGISILHGTDMDLALAIRRHGNFVETVPMALILLALAEANAAPLLLLHGAGLALLGGRIAHAMGLSIDNPKAPLRIAGGSLTILAMLAAIGWLAWASVT